MWVLTDSPLVFKKIKLKKIIQIESCYVLEMVLTSLWDMHPLLMIPKDIFLYKPQITFTTPSRELFPLMFLQMLYEVIHILMYVSRRREYSCGFETERTLYRRAVIVSLVKVIDSLLMIGATVSASTTLVGKLWRAMFFGHVLAEDERIHVLGFTYEADETIVEFRFGGMRRSWKKSKKLSSNIIFKFCFL